MENLTYFDQLKHPRWQRRRLEALSNANFECSNCGDKDSTLNVHHKKYVKGRKAWEYEINELSVLCEKCHKSEHDCQDLIKKLLSETVTNENVSLLAGFHSNDYLCCCISESDICKARNFNPLAYAAGFVAYLVYTLCDINQMLQVAKLCASFIPETSETYQVYKNRGNTFGEEE